MMSVRSIRALLLEETKRPMTRFIQSSSRLIHIYYYGVIVTMLHLVWFFKNSSDVCK
jgi:hypothetical protein